MYIEGDCSSVMKMASDTNNFRFIECTALFYQKGKWKGDYLNKQKFRCKIKEENVKDITLKGLKKLVVEQGGVREIAKRIGLGDSLEIQLARASKVGKDLNVYNINTDIQVEFEMEMLLSKGDSEKLQVTIYPLDVIFTKHTPIINIQVGDAHSSPEESESLSTAASLQDENNLNIALMDLSSSKVVESSADRLIKVKGKIHKWPWNILCGLCKEEKMLRFDAQTAGRVEYFKKRHYTKCSLRNKKKVGDKRQRSLFDCMASGNVRREDENTGVAKQRRTDIDSDIEISSDDEDHSANDKSLGDENSDVSSTISERDVSLDDLEHSTTDSDNSNSDIEVIENHFDSEESTRFISLAFEEADPICKQLNSLISLGVIKKDQILYKYLVDLTKSFENPFHEYSRDVKEFFASIVYLGGARTYNFIRGPMFLGHRANLNRNKEDCLLNFGGPSVETLRKSQTPFTCNSGVFKYLNLLHTQLCQSPATEAAPLISNDKVVIIPVCLGNDGTPLKPGIQFDERGKNNIGLSFPVDLDYCKKNRFLSSETLKSSLVMEALVSSVTSLDNSCSCPVAVEYSAKSGKTGENMKELLSNQIRFVQMCYNCQKRSKTSDLVQETSNLELCISTCKECISIKSTCNDCRAKGFVSHIPSIRQCQYCAEHNLTCVKRVVMVLTLDCEEGNKKCMEMIKEELISGTIDIDLLLMVPLPDIPHVLKTLKASFANWNLQFWNERGSLSVLYTLRNKAEPEVRKEIRNYLRRNDYVRNRDRQDPTAVLKLCNPRLTEYISELGYVSHTIIPDTIRFTNNNQVGMYPKIEIIAIGPNGYLLFSTYESVANTSTVFQAQLHNPINKIEKIATGISGHQLHYNGYIVFCTGKSSPITFRSLDKMSNTPLSVNKINTKEKLKSVLQRFNICVNGNKEACKQRLVNHLRKVNEKYDKNGWDKQKVNFAKDDLNYNGLFDSIIFADSSLLYAASTLNRSIVSVSLTRDGVGLQGESQHLIPYEEQWNYVSNLVLIQQSLLIFHNTGALLLNLESFSKVVITSMDGVNPRHACQFKDGFLFTTYQDHMVYFWDDKKVVPFAGTPEEGSRDGTAAYCQFYNPTGLAVEFEHVVYVCDSAVGSIKQISTMQKTAEFLNAIGKIISAFSIHEKHGKFEIKSIDEAISLVHDSLNFLRSMREHISATHGISDNLNGPQGSISAKTFKSVQIVEWCLEALKENTGRYGYEHINLLSCLTLYIEHFHSTVNYKCGMQTMVQYARSFTTSIKESIKRLSDWGAHYYTSAESWYPVPDNSISLSDLEIPTAIPSTYMSKENIQLMREWASVNGAIVRQRTVRQETTMAKAGTLPHTAYNNDLTPNEEHLEVEDHGSIESNEYVQNDEYDTDISDDGLDETGDIEDDPTNYNEVPVSMTFLVGATTRSGRSVKVTSKS